VKKTVLIVGAGFAGSVCAERLAREGWKVLVIDRRSHIGGNAFDEKDELGLMVHRYGPHIFHTNSARIFNYLSQFTTWRPYEHKVLAHLDGKLYPVPINRITINKLYGMHLDANDAQKYIESVRVWIDKVESSEDLVRATVGDDLCDKFYRGYTKKQWGTGLENLKASVAARLPVRFDDDCRYFTDAFQFMPTDGYTALFKQMLSAENIEVKLETSFEDLISVKEYDLTIFTGPIDSYFGYCFGRLPYRSIRFEHRKMVGTTQFQSVGTVNYPSLTDGDFTRVTEFKHLTGDKSDSTSVVYEHPTDLGDPYYPVPTVESDLVYQRYRKLAEKERRVKFVGRLAEYKYYNMDQVVGASLKLAESICGAE
jgi:UDP-galactopyranose mutase